MAVEDAGDDGADDDAVHGLLGVAFGSDELFEGEHTDSEGRAEEHEVYVDAGRFVGAAGCTHDAGDRVSEDEADSCRDDTGTERRVEGEGGDAVNFVGGLAFTELAGGEG